MKLASVDECFSLNVFVYIKVPINYELPAFSINWAASVTFAIGRLGIFKAECELAGVQSEFQVADRLPNTADHI